MLKQFFEIDISVNNLWIYTGIYLLLNIGFILFFPKYNIVKFIKIPVLKNYTLINKFSFYFILGSTIFIPFETKTINFYIGTCLFLIGILFYAAAMLFFAISEYHLPATEGIYKFSRHPVYISFFIIISGMIIISVSGILFIIALLHFYSAYFIIKEEEKDCEIKFGKAYLEYKQKTRKYI